jgi:hypothetical protein
MTEITVNLPSGIFMRSNVDILGEAINTKTSQLSIQGDTAQLASSFEGNSNAVTVYPTFTDFGKEIKVPKVLFGDNVNLIYNASQSESVSFQFPLKSTGTYSLATTDDIPKNRSFGVVFDGGGAVLTTGLQADVVVPYSMTISSWTLIADQVGSIVIDIWKDNYDNYPAVVGDSITGSAKPTLSSVIKNQNSTLTGWTTTVNSGDIIRFNVDSVSTITKATLVIQGTQN